jgi:hypothetical protein
LLFSPLRAATTLALAAGLLHLLWVTLVALGWAAPVVDWVLAAHFLSLPLHVTPFDLGVAAAAVARATMAGFVAGWGAATVGNHLLEAAPTRSRANPPTNLTPRQVG